jgi:hypothetical protein
LNDFGLAVGVAEHLNVRGAGDENRIALAR